MKRKILKGIGIPICICVSYTIISAAASIVNLLSGIEATNNWNSIFMLVWTSIAVFVLSIHHLFDEFSPLVMLVVQYAIVMGLVLLSVYIMSFFEEVSKGGYKDVILSFSVPYIIGAAVYYITLFRATKRQDALLQEIIAEQIKKEAI